MPHYFSPIFTVDVMIMPRVTQDLYRWWFRMVCSDGNMRIKPRRWGDVVRDPRYELTYG